MLKSPETVVLPAAVDLHVHLREPGSNKAETIASGTRAALLGGFALVCDMPNNPGRPTWTAEALAEKQNLIRHKSHLPVATYAGAQPDSDNIGELAAISADSIGLKLYGAPTTGNIKNYDPEDFREIVQEWHGAAPDKPIMLHSGEDNLEGFIGLIPREFGHHLHVCHINSAADARLVGRAKAEGLPVSCGVCPHHLLKTSHDVAGEGWFARMKPPLARQVDAEALMDLLADGTIDVLETDHAPHSLTSKWRAEADNPMGLEESLGGESPPSTCFGVPGIEFALPLLFYQMKRGRIGAERLLEAISSRPADIIGVRLAPRTETAWSMEEYRIDDEEAMAISGSGWTPYLGKLALGKLKSTTILGKKLVHEGKLVGSYPRVVNREGVI